MYKTFSRRIGVIIYWSIQFCYQTSDHMVMVVLESLLTFLSCLKVCWPALTHRDESDSLHFLWKLFSEYLVHNPHIHVVFVIKNRGSDFPRSHKNGWNSQKLLFETESEILNGKSQKLPFCLKNCHFMRDKKHELCSTLLILLPLKQHQTDNQSY